MGTWERTEEHGKTAAKLMILETLGNCWLVEGTAGSISGE